MGNLLQELDDLYMIYLVALKVDHGIKRKKTNHWEPYIPTRFVYAFFNYSEECENQGTKLSRAEIESRIKGIQERLSELDALEKKVKENGPIYITDPDSRLMRMNNNGGDICHNV